MTIGEYKEDESMSERAKIIIIIICFILFIRIAIRHNDFEEYVNAVNEELYYKLQEKDEQIEELELKIDELRDNYSDIQYELWEIIEFLENFQ